MTASVILGVCLPQKPPAAGLHGTTESLPGGLLRRCLDL